MKKLLSLTLFLITFASNAAIVSIENIETNGGGAISSFQISGESTVSTSHSGIASQFDDTWNIATPDSDLTLTIVNTVPVFDDFNVEYSVNNGDTWTTYPINSELQYSQEISANILNVDNFQLHVFGDGSNQIGLSSSYQLTVGEVSNVPVPAAVWLFGSGLIGLVSIKKRGKS